MKPWSREAGSWGVRLPESKSSPLGQEKDGGWWLLGRSPGGRWEPWIGSSCAVRRHYIRAVEVERGEAGHAELSRLECLYRLPPLQWGVGFHSLPTGVWATGREWCIEDCPAPFPINTSAPVLCKARPTGDERAGQEPKRPVGQDCIGRRGSGVSVIFF